MIPLRLLISLALVCAICHGVHLTVEPATRWVAAWMAVSSASYRADEIPARSVEPPAARFEPPGKSLGRRLPDAPLRPRPATPIEPPAFNLEAVLASSGRNFRQAMELVGPPVPPWVRLGISREAHEWRRKVSQGCYPPGHRAQLDAIERLHQRAMEEVVRNSTSPLSQQAIHQINESIRRGR